MHALIRVQRGWPLAIVYIGGFLFSLVLRRFAVPALYEMLARLCRDDGTCA